MKGNEGYEGHQEINQGKIIKCRDRRKGCKEELWKQQKEKKGAEGNMPRK